MFEEFDLVITEKIEDEIDNVAGKDPLANEDKRTAILAAREIKSQKGDFDKIYSNPSNYRQYNVGNLDPGEATLLANAANPQTKTVNSLISDDFKSAAFMVSLLPDTTKLYNTPLILRDLSQLKSISINRQEALERGDRIKRTRYPHHPLFNNLDKII
ncbi:MAG: hypothetical protein ABEK50_11280 [bacterium]